MPLWIILSVLNNYALHTPELKILHVKMYACVFNHHNKPGESPVITKKCTHTVYVTLFATRWRTNTVFPVSNAAQSDGNDE